jgi:predicted GH43/DUF377 family glycosyl hydrolase
MLNLKESLIEKVSYLFRERKNPLFHQPLSSSQNKTNRSIWILIIFIILFVLVAGVFFQRRLWRISHRQKITNRLIKKLKNRNLSTPYYLNKIPAPQRFAFIPYGEDIGLVVGVKNINIRNVIAPYNASLIQSTSTSGYDLFFRYDVISSKPKYCDFYSRIGVVHLNDQFEQGDEEFKRIDVQTEYAEDPRAFFINDQLYIFYNVLNNKNIKNRSMYVANLDKKSFKVNYSTMLDMNLQWIEKNWSPFEYVGIDQRPELLIEYQISPRKLLNLSDPCIGELKSLTLPKEISYFPLDWSKKWGEARGGTPAQKIGDVYLGFFHSSFKESDESIWYVMGAYTFEAQPPFRITGVSNYPILFRGIFDTPHINTASLDKRVIFPAGFILEKREGRELIHLACGENDSSIKIITLDKEKLLKSMNRFEY